MRQALVVLVLMASIVAAVSARAGWKDSSPVSVNPTTRVASGSLSAARASSNSYEYIGCYMWAGDTGEPLVSCRASNSTGVTGYCYSQDTKHIKAVQMIGQSSRLRFTWQSSNVCSQITVDNGSPWLE